MTKRREIILRLWAEGHAAKAIAYAMGTTVGTIKTTVAQERKSGSAMAVKRRAGGHRADFSDCINALIKAHEMRIS